MSDMRRVGRMSARLAGPRPLSWPTKRHTHSLQLPLRERQRPEKSPIDHQGTINASALAPVIYGSARAQLEDASGRGPINALEPGRRRTRAKEIKNCHLLSARK
jgi:hypothetical protein